MNKSRILFSMPSKSHIEIALDEISGLQEYGYICGQFPYAAREGIESKLGRMLVVFKNAFNLVKISYNFKPDIIYFNSRLEEIAGMRDFITIIIFKLFYRKKVYVVLKSHGSDPDVCESENFFIRRIVLPYLKKEVSGWLFLSSEERDGFVQSGSFSPNKVFVTKNIVRVGQFSTNDKFRERLNIAPNQKILLFAGRIIKEKGIYEVVESFIKLCDTFNPILIIVGDGIEYESVKRLINDKGFTNKTILTGFIPEQDVVEYYANCDILVFPTFFPEGFPMALFNSIAAGLSIITTPIRAAADYLSEPENCLWVEPKNSLSVYNALYKLLISPTLMGEMKVNNLLKAKSFSREQVCEELSFVIETIINDSKSQPAPRTGFENV